MAALCDYPNMIKKMGSLKKSIRWLESIKKEVHYVYTYVTFLLSYQFGIGEE